MTTKIQFQVGATANGAPIQAFSNEVKKLEQTTRSVSGSFVSFGEVVKGFLTYKAISFVKDFGVSIFQLADQMEAASIATGINAESLQKLRIVAEQNNITFESLQGGLKKLAKGFFDAQTGSKEFVTLFKTLGVNLKETNLEKVLEQTSKGFAKLQDGTAKQALASKAFGRALSADAIPFLNDLAKGLGGVSAIMTNDMVDRINDIADRFKLMRAQAQGFGASILADVLPSFSKIFDYFDKLSKSKNDTSWLSEILQAFVDVGIEVLNFVDIFATSFKNISSFAKAGINELKSLFTRDPAAKEALLKENKSLMDLIDQRNKEFLERQKELFKGSFLRSGNTYKEFKDKLAAETKPEEKAKGGNIRVDEENFNENKRKNENEAKKYAEQRIEKIRLETAALTRSNEEQKLANELKQLEFHGLKRNSEEYANYAEQITEAIKAQEEMRTKASTGAYIFFRDYAESATNAAEITKLAFTSVFKGLEDTLVDFITKGKASFADFARAIIADITRIYVRAAITGPLAQALQGAFAGGIGGVLAQGAGAAGINPNVSTINVPTGYANGGIVDRPTVAMFGEAGAEAFVPLPDGKRIPVAMQNNAKGDTNVNVTVNAQTGSVETSGDSSRYNRFGEAISQAVQAEIIRQKRAGGLLS